MGLFSKSKKVNEYEEASNNLNNEATTLDSEIVIFEQILQYQHMLIITLYFSSKKGSIKRSVFENNGKICQ